MQLETDSLNFLVPSQIMAGDVGTLNSAGSSVKNTISSFTAGNLFLNLLFAASLKYLWKMLDSLQLMLFLPMLSVTFPGNSKYFFEIVLGLLNLKILDADYILEQLGLDELASGVSKSDEYGMGRDKSMIQNLGVFFVLIVLVAIIGMIIAVLVKILWKYVFVKKIAMKIYDIAIFNALLRSLVQAYIVFSTSTLLNCARPNFKN